MRPCTTASSPWIKLRLRSHQSHATVRLTTRGLQQAIRLVAQRCIGLTFRFCRDKAITTGENREDVSWQEGTPPELMLSHHTNKLYNPGPALVLRFATASTIAALVSAHHLTDTQSILFTSSNLNSHYRRPVDHSPLLRIPKHYGHPLESKPSQGIRADRSIS